MSLVLISTWNLTPKNNTLLIVDKALNQLLMMMFNQYTDRAVLSLQRLQYLPPGGQHAGYARLHDQLVQNMEKKSKEETGLVDLNSLWL